MRPYPVNQQAGSVLIIVLWIAFGLVAITLYFAQAMTSELRVSDNRVSGLMAEQAIEGAARYVSYVLTNLATNGAIPNTQNYYREAVPVSGLANDDNCAHFWLIGRDNDNNTQVQPNLPYFGLIDEASKLNLNIVTNTTLEMLPNMTQDFAAAIVDWRDSDDNVLPLGAESANYANLHPPYSCKNTNFDSLDELRLVYGASMDLLVGEDLNRNGVLDPNEYDLNRNGQADLGIFEYATVYSREPNTLRTNVNNRTQLRSLLETILGTGRANEIIQKLGPATGGGGGGGRGAGTGGTGAGGAGAGGAGATTTFRSLLGFYRRSGMSLDEFDRVGTMLTVASNSYILGRINVNTASAAVLACLPGLTSDTALQLVNYRKLNPYHTSIAWVVEALGNNDTVLQTLAQYDCITTQSYQFTADIAALGPYGRGYRRVKFVFDLSNGGASIIYRQDLTHLGWALGKEVRQTWLSAKKLP